MGGSSTKRNFEAQHFMTTLKNRTAHLLESFHSRFGNAPAPIVVRAPGRVNLIGEHTDYNGYPVLPMAIDRDILLALSQSAEQNIVITNTNPSFSDRNFSIEEIFKPFAQGDWGNYVKAALRGLIEHKLLNAERLSGMQMMFSGNIPESAGLSSSSALVVATAVGVLTALQVTFDRLHLAEILAGAERYAGLEGGGMDQAISLLASTNEALKIDFFPLRTSAVALPQDISVVICNSLIRAPKTASAKYEYNRRVVECRLATTLIEKLLSIILGKNISARMLADLAPEKIGLSEDRFHNLALEALDGSPLPLEVIAQRLAASPSDLIAQHCTMKDGSVVQQPPEGFEVQKRYLHVASEAWRVEQAALALRESDFPAFAEFVNASHESCRDDYEVSCAELEALVFLARKNGAHASRLTGAGFGGCTVNFLETSKVGEFIAAMTRDYYEAYVTAHPEAPFISYKNIGEVLFECHASEGAGVITDL